jgi:hypothetical protein
VDGSWLYLYEQGATKSDHAVVSFTSGDVAGQVTEFRKNGVSFEEYDKPDPGTVNGIATMWKIKAWFKDSEGNILALSNL